MIPTDNFGIEQAGLLPACKCCGKHLYFAKITPLKQVFCPIIRVANLRRPTIQNMLVYIHVLIVLAILHYYCLAKAPDFSMVSQSGRANF